MHVVHVNLSYKMVRVLQYYIKGGKNHSKYTYPVTLADMTIFPLNKSRLVLLSIWEKSAPSIVPNKSLPILRQVQMNILIIITTCINMHLHVPVQYMGILNIIMLFYSIFLGYVICRFHFERHFYF